MSPYARRPRKARETDLSGAGKQFEGLLPNLRRRYDEGTWSQQEELEPYRSLRACATCHGQRLKPQSLADRVKGRTISDYVRLPSSQALPVFVGLYLTVRQARLA